MEAAGRLKYIGAYDIMTSHAPPHMTRRSAYLYFVVLFHLPTIGKRLIDL